MRPSTFFVRIQSVDENQQPVNQPPAPSQPPQGQSDEEPVAKDGPTVPAAVSNEQTPPPPVASQESRKKVLLIEDDLPMVRMYTTRLEKENIEVVVAQDGQEGLQKTREWSPDLVILDLMIPKIGGMEILEQLRSQAKTKNLPVIILSNLSQEQDIQRSQQLGVKEFLVKANYTPSQVVGKIKAYLG